MSAGGDVMHAGSVLRTNRVWLSEGTIICARNIIERPRENGLQSLIRSVGLLSGCSKWRDNDSRRRTNKKMMSQCFYFSRNFSLSLSPPLSLCSPLFRSLLPSPLHTVHSQTAPHTSICVRYGVM